MQIFKTLALSATFALAGTSYAQPPEAGKTAPKETSDQFMKRVNAERKARVTKDFEDALRTKFQLSEADIGAIRSFIERGDAQLQLARSALYQLTLAADGNLSDAEFAEFWNDFQTMTAKHREQKVQAEGELTRQLKLDQNLRLRAYLTTRGVIGEESALVTLPSQSLLQTDLLQFTLKRELDVDKPKRVVAPDTKTP